MKLDSEFASKYIDLFAAPDPDLGRNSEREGGQRLRVRQARGKSRKKAMTKSRKRARWETPTWAKC